MKSVVVRLLQEMLQQARFDPGPIDGHLGDHTYRAVHAALERRTSGLPAEWQSWSNRRQAVAYLQLLCKDKNIEVGVLDGYWGPQTDYAVDTLLYLREHGQLPPPWRDLSPLDANPNGWPRQNESQLTGFYGAVGVNQVRIQLPYPHRLAWDLNKTVQSFSCHAKVHDSLQRVLQKVLDHYGLDEIKRLRLDRWGGSLNVRKMRGGTQWSMHSWGIAIDYDPERNQLNWGRDRAAFARPEYDAWWRCWEEEGWVSLGRHKNYDWMHVQAAKL